MNKEKLVPKLRFGQFKNNDEWKKESIGNLVTIGSGVSPVKFKHGDYLYVKVNDLNFSSRYQLNTVTRVSFNGNANLINKNSIVFPKRGAAILTNKVRILKENSYMDTNMMALTPQKINSDFLYSFISKTSLYKIADTSTIPQINNKHLEPYQIYIPNSSEQYKIGFFFEKIDKMIQLQQSKVNKVKDIKSAYLSEMFPKEGEKYPKKRFEGLKNNWNPATFSDFLKTESFKKYLAKEDRNGIFPIIQQGDSPIEGYGDGIPYKDYDSVVLFGDHTLSLYRPESPFLIASDGIKILSNNKMDRDYFYYLLQRYIPESEGYKRHYSILKNKVINITENKEEQVKIGNFFKNLDNQISIEEEKLVKLEKLKQAYLNEMFV